MVVSEAHVLPGFLTPVQKELPFQSHRLLFSHALAMRGKNTPERKFATARYWTHNHQAMSRTCSSLSSVDRVQDLRTGGPWFDSGARPVFFLRIDDNHCNRIYSTLNIVHCFGGCLGKQPVAWKEYVLSIGKKKYRKAWIGGLATASM